LAAVGTGACLLQPEAGTRTGEFILINISPGYRFHQTKQTQEEKSNSVFGFTSFKLLFLNALLLFPLVKRYFKKICVNMLQTRFS
jgi:hypothetical protein